MSRVKYICTSPEISKENKTPPGTFTIIQEARTLYYNPSLGRSRVYRQSSKTPKKGMKRFEYVRKENAQKLADEVNKALNDDFKVEEVKS